MPSDATEGMASEWLLIKEMAYAHFGMLDDQRAKELLFNWAMKARNAWTARTPSAREVELEAALTEVLACFEAAKAEGLYDRLVEMQPGEPGNLRGLYERRLSFAEIAATRALASGQEPG